jgi:flagellar export protein FliJ
MARFQFKFATVERVRKQREEEALRVLGDMQRAYQAAISHKNKLLSDLAEALVRRENLGQKPVGIVAFKTEQDFIVGTKQRALQADQRILRARRSVEKALRTYMAARQQTRMVEVLREKAFADWRKEQAKKEQRQLDELYVMRARMAGVVA